jgi:hypothetical protein
MTIDEQVEVLLAIKKGQKIEAQPKNREGGWTPCDNKDLNFIAFDYRIVPEPRRWVIYEWGNELGVVPYSEYLPTSATIICTATEDTNLGEEAAPYLEALKEKISRPSLMKMQRDPKL